MIHHPFLFSISVLLTCFGLTLILTERVRRILLAKSLLDIPNDRSSHKIPMPRGGGWALMLVILPALLLGTFLIDGDARHAGLIAGVGLLAAISWADDRREVRAFVRLGAHLLAAGLGSLCLGPHALLFGGWLPFALDRALLILGWGWFINLYNFMDGIDGITGVETISLATGMCLVMSAASLNDPYLNLITLMLTGCCLGFLAHNWHPAKIFLGDIGSVPLGYLTGFGLLTLAVHGYPIPALILPLYYIADSGMTLGKRALRGEKIWQAHRQHFYQQAALRAGRHDRVVIWIACANSGLIVASLAALKHPALAATAAIALVAVLLLKMHKKAS